MTHVEYVTDEGRKFVPLIDTLGDWWEALAGKRGASDEATNTSCKASTYGVP